MLIYIHQNYVILNKNNNFNNNNNYIIIIYNIDFYKSIVLNEWETIIDKHHRYIKTYFNYKLCHYILNNFMFLWDNLFFKKLSYKGKSFKFKKKKNTINFVLNTSHLIWASSITHIIRKLSKLKLIYFFNNLLRFNTFIFNVLSYRRINIYTKRGLRLSRLKIYKKRGKTNMKV